MYEFGDPNLALTVQSAGVAPRTLSNSGQIGHAEEEAQTTRLASPALLVSNAAYQWHNEVTVWYVTVGERVRIVAPPLRFRWSHDAKASGCEIRGIELYEDLVACGARLSDAYDQLVEVLLPSLWGDVRAMEEGAKFTKRARLLVEDFRKRVGR